VMTIFQWTTLVVTCAALMWALSVFDRLIALESADSGGRHPGDRSARRNGIRAKGTPFQRGLARNRLFVKWLFQTPEWAQEIRTNQMLFQRFRFGSAIALTGFVAFGAGSFLHI
jgi:hypothetical protein